MSTLGAFLFAVAVLLFLIDVDPLVPLGAERGQCRQRVRRGTLEWLPSALYSTRSIPVVNSRYPLWDDPKLARDVEQGRYFLPGSATGLRETIVTSPVLAEPQYVEIMPGPSPWPFWSAIATAVFFLALTVQAYAVSVVAGITMVLTAHALAVGNRPADRAGQRRHRRRDHASDLCASAATATAGGR